MGFFFLTEKLEALATLKRFKAYVEKEAAIFMKMLRIDLGRDFAS